MAKKKVSKFEKFEQLVSEAKSTKWCSVDINNRFSYMEDNFQIRSSVSQYTVANPPRKSEKGNWNNWTNESQMDMILVVDDGHDLRFFDQNFEEIDQMKVEFV